MAEYGFASVNSVARKDNFPASITFSERRTNTLLFLFDVLVWGEDQSHAAEIKRWYVSNISGVDVNPHQALPILISSQSWRNPLEINRRNSDFNPRPFSTFNNIALSLERGVLPMRIHATSPYGDQAGNGSRPNGPNAGYFERLLFLLFGGCFVVSSYKLLDYCFDRSVQLYELGIYGGVIVFGIGAALIFLNVFPEYSTEKWGQHEIRTP